MKHLEAIAIIPARGGSKRIPKKNIRPFLGKPIVAYSIQAARKAKCFGEVMVSTESSEVAKVAKKYKASIPFMRSSENASDTATVADVVLEVILEYKKRGVAFDYFCCILPTVPTLSPDKVYESFNLLKSKKADAVLPVVEYEHPVQRAFKASGKYIKMRDGENAMKRSQDLVPMYHDAGRFVWVKTSEFLRRKTFFMPKTIPMIFPRLIVQDIDTEDDWKLAELKYYLLKQLKTKPPKWNKLNLFLALLNSALIMELIIL